MDPPEPPDLSRYIRNPLLARRIEDCAAAVLVAALGGGAGGVPRGVVLGLAERCHRQSELLSRRAEKA